MSDLSCHSRRDSHWHTLSPLKLLWSGTLHSGVRLDEIFRGSASRGRRSFSFQLVTATGIATSNRGFCRQETYYLQHRSRKQHPYTARALPQPASSHPFIVYRSASLHLHPFVMSASTASGNSSRMEPFQAYVNCRCHLLLRQVWNARHACRNF